MQLYIHDKMKLDQFKKKPKTKAINIRIDEDLYKKLQKLDINVSEAIRYFLEKLAKGEK